MQKEKQSRGSWHFTICQLQHLLLHSFSCLQFRRIERKKAKIRTDPNFSRILKVVRRNSDCIRDKFNFKKNPQFCFCYLALGLILQIAVNYENTSSVEGKLLWIKWRQMNELLSTSVTLLFIQPSHQIFFKELISLFNACL